MRKNYTPDFAEYKLIDSGEGEKLESWNGYVTRRPEPQALWRRSLSEKEWQQSAHASFLRSGTSEERGDWRIRKDLPRPMHIKYHYKDMHLTMRLGLTSFKHVGIFPEQGANWNYIYDNCLVLKDKLGSAPKVLNLFAYTGGASLAARSAGAEVTHVDSVKQVVSWSRENMELSKLSNIRWIVEDAVKFVEREVRRGNRYNGIIIDPPAYGRGTNGERWILEEGLTPLLELLNQLLEPQNSFMVMSLYSMGLSPTVARTAAHGSFGTPQSEELGELYFSDSHNKELPMGTFYRFKRF